jgi:hypothetical protein
MKKRRIGDTFIHPGFGYNVTAKLVAINGKRGVFDTDVLTRIERVPLNDPRLKRLKKKKWMH